MMKQPLLQHLGGGGRRCRLGGLLLQLQMKMQLRGGEVAVDGQIERVIGGIIVDGHVIVDSRGSSG